MNNMTRKFLNLDDSKFRDPKLNYKKIKKSKKLFHNTNQKQLNCILMSMIYNLKIFGYAVQVINTKILKKAYRSKRVTENFFVYKIQ
ncbi:hypothetical protein BpHYR1_014981 [Brachionus plicatilis]|uniref:Uncharacterized protein n=1 Tax=Brachionus plicatilis TaxID=10195 RepID=A0A3M7SWP7_BRAPC|nr:hypothetical protein BpHYR1_014981 [Brachionus plicatilis]